MHVEGLSEQVQLERTERLEPDDFGGEAIRVQVLNNLKPKAEAKVITNYRKLRKEEKLKAEAEAVRRYVEQRDRAHKMIADKLNPPKSEPKLSHNQVLTQSGLVFTPIVPRKPWRRM